MASAVSLSKVSKSYGRQNKKTIALKPIDLDFKQGELVVLSGSNGTGKTTLLHIVAGLLRPDSGKVIVGGQDLSKLNESMLDIHRARNIGYLLQDNMLMGCLTARENVMAPMLFARKSSKEQRKRADELLERFDVLHRANHLPDAMSGGERQRVALARALVNDPPLLLADEPLASLDAPSAKRFMELLSALVKNTGLSMLMVTHRLELMPEMARIVEMRK